MKTTKYLEHIRRWAWHKEQSIRWERKAQSYAEKWQIRVKNKPRIPAYHKYHWAMEHKSQSRIACLQFSFISFAALKYIKDYNKSIIVI